MSDSHDDLDMIESAVSTFNAEKVEYVLHAGDLVSPFTARAFKELKPPMAAVFGNNDGDPLALVKHFEGIATFHGRFADLELGGRRVAVLHGEHPKLVSALVTAGTYDLVVRGHTHAKEILQRERTLLINPGETCPYLTGLPTVMVVDLASMEPRLVELETL
jgi:putative phosphoesterase